MGKELLDNCWIFNAGNYFHYTATLITDFDINTKDDLIADECTAGELKQVHDQLQEAIKSRDPAQLIRDKKLAQQLLIFEESNPIIGKVIKDLMNALSGMGI